MAELPDDPYNDELYFEELEYEPPEPPAWRRPLLLGIALVTAVAMAGVPVYNLIAATRTPVAANGLAVCTHDYCIVHDAMRERDLDLSMSRYANQRLDDAGAERLAQSLAEQFGTGPVSVVVLDQLQGGVEGIFNPATRTIVLRRPVSVWTVLHEVAHTEAPGHGEDFMETLAEMTRWLDSGLAEAAMAQAAI